MGRKQRNRGNQYTIEERFKYHTERDTACGKFGLEFGSPKHTYSSGFRDAFMNIDNRSGVRSEFGAKSARAYSSGHARGEKAAREYFDKTGKQPSELTKYNWVK